MGDASMRAAFASFKWEASSAKVVDASFHRAVPRPPYARLGLLPCGCQGRMPSKKADLEATERMEEEHLAQLEYLRTCREALESEAGVLARKLEEQQQSFQMASTSVEDLHCLMHSLDSDMQQLSTDVPFCEEQRAKYLTYMEFEVRACIENAWSLLHKVP
ncbi:hypothetical protein MRB53_016697 [Persea americana]|uniref:Uncharacterized protein n=1 Tax=Persea americana TaxID=3435 RepID=A0ACC2M3G0_PERAE|nr:hypothetical protein MRB53_016697 [Persea americana]